MRKYSVIGSFSYLVGRYKTNGSFSGYGRRRGTYRQRSFQFVLSTLLIMIVTGLSGCVSESGVQAGYRKKINSSTGSLVIGESEPLSSNPAHLQTSVKVNDYILGPNDVLFISVNGRAEFGSVLSFPVTNSFSNSIRGYRVDGTGCIYLPLAGKLMVAGFSLAEVRDRIRIAMTQYYGDPSVVVEISEFRARQVFIFGAVKKPGPFPMPPAGLNMAQLISVADTNDSGGKFREVRIIRSNSPTEGELLVVDFENVLHGKALPMELQEGDIVYIPKSRISSWNKVLSDLLPSLQAFSATLQPFVNIKYLKQ